MDIKDELVDLFGDGSGVSFGRVRASRELNFPAILKKREWAGTGGAGRSRLVVLETNYGDGDGE